ncbi:MAG: hypothetical protein JWM72_870 [Actinomycetia bacterium]|nr:hypothetical protein [Actinomycetes bacterium]
MLAEIGRIDRRTDGGGEDEFLVAPERGSKPLDRLGGEADEVSAASAPLTGSQAW